MTTEEQFEKKQKEMSDNDLIELSEKIVHELARTGGKSMVMCVPPMTTDPDMALCELIQRFKLTLKN